MNIKNTPAGETPDHKPTTSANSGGQKHQPNRATLVFFPKNKTNKKRERKNIIKMQMLCKKSKGAKL